MLKINQLSFWERSTFFEEIDFAIIGTGIVACSTALHLRKKYPTAKIILLERGYLPMGASTKNAGFACFGSVTELIDDLNHIPEKEVWSTVQKRWEGLIYLKEIIGEKHLDFQNNGSWDLIGLSIDEKPYLEQLDYLNEQILQITGKQKVYSLDSKVSEKFGFGQIKTSFNNRLEAQVDTGKMMLKYHHLMVEHNIQLVHGIDIKNIHTRRNGISLETTIGTINSNKLAVCVNGFAQQLLPELAVKPARAQVLITKPIENLPLKGTFHYQQGYYYFRNIGNRILFGGGRNLDFQTETTFDFENTPLIQEDLIEKLHTIIIPYQAVEVDYFWSGIMGVGETKKPIVEKYNEHICLAVRMGGMGVAIGSLVGKECAELF